MFRTAAEHQGKSLSSMHQHDSKADTFQFCRLEAWGHDPLNPLHGAHKHIQPGPLRHVLRKSRSWCWDSDCFYTYTEKNIKIKDLQVYKSADGPRAKGAERTKQGFRNGFWLRRIKVVGILSVLCKGKHLSFKEVFFYQGNRARQQ